MPRTDYYTGVTMYCVVCQKPIPKTRRWDAFTCSKECTKARNKFGLSHRDAVQCRYCYHPSSPEERRRYLRWRKAEERNPPAEAELSPDELQNREFGRQLVSSLRHDLAILKRKLAVYEPPTAQDDAGTLPTSGEGHAEER